MVRSRKYHKAAVHSLQGNDIEITRHPVHPIWSSGESTSALSVLANIELDWVDNQNYLRA